MVPGLPVRKSEVIQRQFVFGFLFNKILMKLYAGVVCFKPHGSVRSEVTGPFFNVLQTVFPPKPENILSPNTRVSSEEYEETVSKKNIGKRVSL